MKYSVRPHAYDRALLRFGISNEQAQSWFNQLMQTARLIGSDGKRDSYDHKGKRIVVEGTEIVTVYNVADLPFGDKVSALVERELNKSKKAYEKRSKELSIEIAEATIEHANWNLNLLKAKSQRSKTSIQRKLDVINEKITNLRLELNREADVYKAIVTQSRGYLMNGGCTG
jgi:hypothetical protein